MSSYTVTLTVDEYDALKDKIARLERAGDVLAHSLVFALNEFELSTWWNLRGGVDACTVCNPEPSGSVTDSIDVEPDLIGAPQ